MIKMTIVGLASTILFHAQTAHAQTLDGCGTGFGLPVGVETGATADVNGDGVLDVLVASGLGTVEVWTGHLTASGYSATFSDAIVLGGAVPPP